MVSGPTSPGQHTMSVLCRSPHPGSNLCLTYPSLGRLEGALPRTPNKTKPAQRNVGNQLTGWPHSAADQSTPIVHIMSRDRRHVQGHQSNSKTTQQLDSRLQGTCVGFWQASGNQHHHMVAHLKLQQEPAPVHCTGKAKPWPQAGRHAFFTVHWLASVAGRTSNGQAT